MTAAKKRTIGKKMQRSVLTVLLVLILLFSSANISAVAAETAVWKVSTSGVISEYTGQDTDLCVPSVVGGQAVTSVDMLSAGRNDYAPQCLVLDEGILFLGRLSFDLRELKEVVLPNTLKAIIDKTFANATAVDELTVPSNVSLICQNAFAADTVLHVYSGSYAHRWALANGQPFYVIRHTPTVGDYDGDGVCTSTDARLLLQAAVGKGGFSAEQLSVADVDNDGVITSSDARLVLQHVVQKTDVATVEAVRTFFVPFVPPEAAETLQGRIVDEYGTVTHGPQAVRDPAAAIRYLNEMISHTYDRTSVSGIVKTWSQGNVFTWEQGGVGITLAQYLRLPSRDVLIATDEERERTLIVE